MNIILIDFAFTSDEKLKKICDELDFDFDRLLNDKNKFKLYRIWCDTVSKTMIAYSITTKPDKIELTDGFNKTFTSLERYEPKTAKPVDYPKADLNIDSILDKISKFGMESLLKEEKEFLDNSSKE